MAKINWVFQDEQGTNLNRYIATNVSTGEKITFDLLRGGNVSVVGTPLNAEKLNSLISAINDNYDLIFNNEYTLSKSNNTITLNRSGGGSTSVTLEKSDIGLGNVDNTSDATKKSNFTGAIASGNTGFVTGNEVYNKIKDLNNNISGNVKYIHTINLGIKTLNENNENVLTEITMNFIDIYNVEYTSKNMLLTIINLLREQGFVAISRLYPINGTLTLDKTNTTDMVGVIVGMYVPQSGQITLKYMRSDAYNYTSFTYNMLDSNFKITYMYDNVQKL